ncbi:MAG: GNAT family N-acetyltransferase, partial [Anaerolineae bacterium]
MAARAISREKDFSGLRPMRASSDLGQVASLIEESFGFDLDQSGIEALRELKVMSHLGPLLWLLERISPEFRNTFLGFVWVEHGQIVGNVTVSVGSAISRRWVISNVAVRPDYRRRGIAYRLMEAALDWARSQGGEWAVLQVRADNEPARRLYHLLGFEEVTAVAELRLEKVRPVAIVSTEGFTLRQRSHREWVKEYRLVKAATSSGAQWVNPVRVTAFNLDPGRRLYRALADFFAGRKVYRLAVENEGRFIALLTVHVSRWESDHGLELTVHPDYRGRLEDMLVTAALTILSGYPPRAVSVNHSTDHPQVIAALKQYGFVEQRTLA